MRFVWHVEGERRYPNSSPEYRPESDSGTIEAEGAGEALHLIITGQGPGATLDNTISWDVIDQFRPITITINPAGPGPD